MREKEHHRQCYPGLSLGRGGACNILVGVGPPLGGGVYGISRKGGGVNF